MVVLKRTKFCVFSLHSTLFPHGFMSVKLALILILTPISLIFIILELLSQSALELAVSRGFCLTWVGVHLVHLSGYFPWVGVYFQVFIIDSRSKGILELYLFYHQVILLIILKLLFLISCIFAHWLDLGCSNPHSQWLRVAVKSFQTIGIQNSFGLSLCNTFPMGIQ